MGLRLLAAPFLVPAVAVLALVVFVGASALDVGAAAGPPTLPVKANPDSVARFGCPKKPRSTVDIEACQARQLIRLDTKFNGKAAVLWSVLDASGRQSFTRAHRAWLTYRHQQCEAEAGAYSGGTAAPVTFGACEIALTAARVTRLSHTISLYCQGRVRIGRFRRCPP
jgi:uncharacterized protein YecT (DUF1311 family)